MAKEYSFVSIWEVKSAIEPVWDTIYESELWPQWWKGVLSVNEIEKGDENGIGSIRVYKMQSPMLYTLRFNLLLTERINYKMLKGIASGELAGTGAWYFEKKDDDTTIIKCYWNVSSTIWWMNSFAFLLSPLFSYNHSVVMRKGAKSLAKKLNAYVRIIS